MPSFRELLAETKKRIREVDTATAEQEWLTKPGVVVPRTISVAGSAPVTVRGGTVCSLVSCPSVIVTASPGWIVQASGISM